MARTNLSLILLVGFLGAFSAARAQNSPHSNSGYIPQRVYDSGQKRFSDFEAMLADLARADVVLVGEQHDDPDTHRLERAILEGLARRRSSIVLALEMFERDVQGHLDDYLAGRLAEGDFLKASRPWPRYAIDYRPLVEFARAHHWPVIAGNTPRRYASQVAKGGLGALDSLPAGERTFIARQIHCPFDEYFKRFAESMAEHPGATGGPGGQSKPSESEQRAMIERFYFAQCIKDETMAESVANLYREGIQSRPLTVHFNGAFHSDYRLGTAARLKQRLPKASTRIVSIVPVDNLDTLRPDEYRKRGDFVVFTLKPLKPATESAGKS